MPVEHHRIAGGGAAGGFEAEAADTLALLKLVATSQSVSVAATVIS